MKQGEYPENMPVLYRNALDAMPSDYARDVWLWAVERQGMDPMGYKADAYALEWEWAANFIGGLVDKANAVNSRLQTGLELPPVEKSDLLNFIERRRANLRMGDNQRPSYALVQK